MRRALEPVIVLATNLYSCEPPSLDSLYSQLIEAAQEEGVGTGKGEEATADPRQRKKELATVASKKMARVGQKKRSSQKNGPGRKNSKRYILLVGLGIHP